MAIVQTAVFSFLFALAGFLIRRKKVYWLIAGYNTMSAEEKVNYDIEKLAKYLGLLLYYIAVIVPVFVWVALPLATSRFMELLLAGIFILSVFGFLIFIVIKALDKDSKKLIIFLSVILFLVCVFVWISQL